VDERAPRTIVIAPEGEFDVARLGEFRAALSRAGAQTDGVVVDLSSVSFIDSSGLSALVDLYDRLHRDNRRLAVVVPAGTAPAVVLNLSGLHSRIPIYATREAALAS
jgi:anti-anti-sigma factor